MDFIAQVKEWWAKPLSQDNTAFQLALLVGFVMILWFGWKIVFDHIENAD